MAKKMSLGRGFDALIPKELDSALLEEDLHRVQKIPISDIRPNPDQPRREVDKQLMEELTSSVKQHGVLQPIIVVRDKSGFRIVAGERRWRAAGAARLTEIPAIVRNLQELEEIELALIENIQRVDLSPLEQAMSVYRLQQQFNLGLEQIAQKLGKAPSTVSNLARLLQLPDSAREALRSGQISEGHARAILALKNKSAQQEQLLSYILNNTWSVRQAEQYVLSVKRGELSIKTSGLTAEDSALQDELRKELKTDVKIRHRAKGGQLVISFKDGAELSRIAKRLKQSD